jgi:hypothetical protein
MKISTQARSKEISRKVEDVWKIFIPVELEKIQVGKGMFPAVMKTTGQVGTREKVGSARIVHMADGSTANEVVTAITSNEEFGYRVSDFTNRSGRLIEHAEGLFTFEESSAGKTTIVWNYAFYMRNFFGGVVFTPVVKIMWRRYLNECLGRLTALAEERIPVK